MYSKKYVKQLCTVLYIGIFMLSVQYCVYSILILRQMRASYHVCGNTKPCNTSSQTPLYIITPTVRRPTQIPELIRLSHTLKLVPDLMWIVVEDATTKSPYVEDLLRKSGLRYCHLNAEMPGKYKLSKMAKPKGVANRLKGLEWIKNHTKTGVIYFADDDNTYDVELFEEIRKTKTVSLFPVGLVTHTGLSTPIVENCTFIGFYDGWYGGRKFPIDMAGFALSVEFLLKRPKATMPFLAGYEEDGFLKSLAPLEAENVELLAECSTKILVWHTKTYYDRSITAMDFMFEKNNTNLVVFKKFFCYIFNCDVIKRLE